MSVAAAQQSSASAVQRYLMTGIEPSDVSSLLEQQRSLVASNSQAKVSRRCHHHGWMGRWNGWGDGRMGWMDGW